MKFIGMTIAITKMEEMLAFYSSVFGITFSEKEMYNSKLYSGKWGELDVLFCSAEIAHNTATQNRHQFDFEVSDLTKTVTEAERLGGSKMGEITEDDQYLSVGIYDPDKNSMTLRQKKG